MGSVLSTLNTAKYNEHATNISNKSRRLAEQSEEDLVKINHQLAQWLLGAVSGDEAIMATALATLKEIYDDDTIESPDNNINSVVTAVTTRRGVNVTLTAGSNVISFSSAMPAATYSLTVRTYTALGGQIQYSIDPTSQTVNGFTIVVASAGKLDYIALYN